ncbi:serine hydrolase [Pikeienuella piscinae]|uniref:Serine hydrolase n=1 Tax=Pikeienuella piscinae TaxID=2748098 RepID=A0A7L5BZI9_9RHOB|nr:serine hydrolase [Pikeienuella piscinae]QIE55284.1 serine hydrolase [Pikeienuella piscinae]
MIMQGFPPAESDRATLANWRSAPWSSWAFHHVREIVPTAEIANDPSDIWELPEGRVDLSGVDLDAAMAETSTDAVVIVHEGRLVHEVYRNGMEPTDPHIIFSVSKSLLGLVAGTLVDRGELKEDDLVTTHVPELGGTAFEGATIRQLLDMRVGVLFDEDYLATEGPIIDYRFAANWNPVPAGLEAGDLRSFMSKLTERDGPHGGRFHYVSPNTDLLAWIFERASGVRYADLVSERLWRPLGAERAGYITLDRIGGARAAGGVCVTARDLARVGMMLADNGSRDGRRVIPASWIEDIEKAGDPAAWNEGDFKDDFAGRAMHYRSKWYVQRRPEPLVHGLGIHGQYVFFDRASRLSIAWMSSRHEPIEKTTTERVLAAVEAIRGAVL